MTEPQSNRASLILLVSLLLPMGTVVLVVYFFSRMTATNAPSTAHNLVAVAGGLSAVMAALVSVGLLVVFRQRNRVQHFNHRLNAYLSTQMDKNLRQERMLNALSCANEVALAVRQETSFDRIASVVLEQIESFSGASDVVVFAGQGGELEPLARRFGRINTFDAEIDGENLEFELPYEAFLSGMPRRRMDSQTGNYSTAIPYASQEGIRGVILVRRNVIDDPDFERELQGFEAALAQLVRSASAVLKFAALWDRAIKDAKTGLFNANHFAKELPRMMSASLKGGKPLSLIMLDIDKFKHINDTFGHLAGDEVLKQVSAILTENLRDTDMAFRYGGEELCIACSNTVGEDAGVFAERLRHAIAHTEFRAEGQLVPVSASFGVAEFDPVQMQAEKDLKEACDRALYHGKENGRNQAVVNRGAGWFHPMPRSGSVETEVKRRLGLAGDNTPLETAAGLVDRRAEPKSGKVGRALAEGELAGMFGDIPDTTSVVRPNPADSIRALAEQIRETAHGDSARVADVARIAGMAAAAMSETRKVKVGDERRAGRGERRATERRGDAEAATAVAERPAERRGTGRRKGNRRGAEAPVRAETAARAEKESIPTNASVKLVAADKAGAETPRVERRKKPRKKKDDGAPAKGLGFVSGRMSAAGTGVVLGPATEAVSDAAADGHSGQPQQELAAASAPSPASAPTGSTSTGWQPRKHW
jgi:diguanylate cyclase (GGDEF)-like protein